MTILSKDVPIPFLTSPNQAHSCSNYLSFIPTANFKKISHKLNLQTYKNTVDILKQLMRKLTSSYDFGHKNRDKKYALLQQRRETPLLQCSEAKFDPKGPLYVKQNTVIKTTVFYTPKKLMKRCHLTFHSQKFFLLLSIIMHQLIIQNCSWTTEKKLVGITEWSRSKPINKSEVQKC